jgi:hypothetical protein
VIQVKEAQVGTNTPPTRPERNPRERETEGGSVGLMLGFVGAATGVFFLVLGLVGVALLAFLFYHLYSYYR